MLKDQGCSQTSLITEAVAKRRRRVLFFRGVWEHAPPENFESEKPGNTIFSVFLVCVPSNIIKIQTNFNSIYVCYQFFSLKFQRFHSEMIF